MARALRPGSNLARQVNSTTHWPAQWHSSGLAALAGHLAAPVARTSGCQRAPAAAAACTPRRQLASSALPSSWDVAIVGLGAFGSAAAYHLSKQGASVLGVDLGPGPGHALGSSHGSTRIYRFAYREGAEYLPLLRYSHQLFLKLEEESGRRLVVQTGILELGANVLAGGSLASARHHGLPHDILTGAQVNARYPGYSVPDSWHGVFQPDGGMLLAEPCVQAHCAGAERSGAHLLWGRRVTRWAPTSSPGGSGGSGVELQLDNGQVVRAGQLVLTAGPWTSQLLPGSQSSLKVVRQVVGYYGVKDPSAFDPDRFPVFILDTDEDSYGAIGKSLYGFPLWTQDGAQAGFKIGVFQHLNEEVPNPDHIHRDITPADLELLSSAVRRHFPKADHSQLLAHTVCMFTHTPDSHFLIDRHPVHPQVLLCSACSGHGFKMSSGVGRLMAEDVAAWAATGRPAPREAGSPQDMLALHRLGNSSERPWLRTLHQALVKH